MANCGRVIEFPVPEYTQRLIFVDEAAKTSTWGTEKNFPC